MAQTKVKLISDGVIDVDHLASGHGITTDNIGEGSNLYYTDARVSTYLSTNSYATEGYVTTAVSDLVAAAPSTLDTLNELAAALGDDPNFATTVTNSIATKLPLAGGTLTGSLGIGTSPSATLDVRRSDTSGLIAEFHQSTGYGIDIGSSESEGYISTGYLQDFIFKTNAGSGQVERMRIDSSGHVTIGDLSSAPTSTVPLTIFKSGANANLAIQSGGGSGRKYELISNTAGDFIVYDVNSSTEKLNIVSGGNIGIGTTSPAAKLHVGSTGANAYSSTITKGSNMKGVITTLSNNTDDMVGIYFATGSTTEGTHWSGITGSRSNSASNWGTQLNFYTHNNDVANINDATQKMVIKGDGKVGIGTSSPDTHLDVSSSIHTKLRVQTTGIADASVEILGYDAGVHIGDPTNGNRWAIWNDGASTSSSLKIGSYALGTWYGDSAQVITMTSSGNVGIGTTSPSQKLQVKGNIQMGVDPTLYWESNTLKLQTSYNSIGVVQLRGSTSYAPRFEVYNANNATKTVQIHGDGTTYFNGGNVGIGTNSPVGKLNVALPADSNGNVGAWGSNQVVFTRGGTSTSQGLGFSVHDVDNTATISSLTPAVTWSKMQFRASDYAFFSNGATLGLSQDTLGNVGIGTFSPASKLDVRGTITTTNSVSKSTNSNTAWTKICKINGSAQVYTLLLGTGENNYSQMWRVSGSAAQQTCYALQLGESNHTHSKDVEFRIVSVTGGYEIQYKNVTYTTSRYLYLFEASASQDVSITY